VLVNGGRADLAPGTWSATLEWLVARLAPLLPELTFVEVRYRIRSWNRFEWCVEDAREAMAAAGDVPLALVGFSMGGAVATRVADDPRVGAVVGLAPWLPDRLDVSPLAGRHLTVVHGSLDRGLPGLPGVSPALSRRGFDRAVAAGARGEYLLVRGGVHAAALRGRGGLVALPRARTYARAIGDALAAFAGTAAPRARDPYD
jgi:pimeloyl-ACP methyl ester carboxylesterase